MKANTSHLEHTTTFVCIILTGALVFVLVGCGDSGTDTSNNTNREKSSTKQADNQDETATSQKEEEKKTYPKELWGWYKKIPEEKRNRIHKEIKEIVKKADDNNWKEVGNELKTVQEGREFEQWLPVYLKEIKPKKDGYEVAASVYGLGLALRDVDFEGYDIRKLKVLNKIIVENVDEFSGLGVSEVSSSVKFVFAILARKSRVTSTEIDKLVIGPESLEDIIGHLDEIVSIYSKDHWPTEEAAKGLKEIERNPYAEEESDTENWPESVVDWYERVPVSKRSEIEEEIRKHLRGTKVGSIQFNAGYLIHIGVKHPKEHWLPVFLHEFNTREDQYQAAALFHAIRLCYMLGGRDPLSKQKVLNRVTVDTVLPYAEMKDRYVRRAVVKVLAKLAEQRAVLPSGKEVWNLDRKTRAKMQEVFEKMKNSEDDKILQAAHDGLDALKTKKK